MEKELFTGWYGLRNRQAGYICELTGLYSRTNAYCLANYLVHVPLLAALAYLLHWRYKASQLREYFWPALGGKLLAGVALGLLYTYYYPYGGDTFFFHREASVLAAWAKSAPLPYLSFLCGGGLPDAATVAPLASLTQPRALVMVKIVSVLHLLTGHNYWLSGAWVSMFSFAGLWSLANGLCVLIPQARKAAAVGFLFFPSVVFWSAGIGKEAVAMGTIGFIVSFVLRHWFRPKPINYLHALLYGTGVVFGLAVLWPLKFYYCAVLVLCLAGCLFAAWLSRTLHLENRAAQFFLFEGGLAVLAGMAFLLPGLSPEGLLTSIVGNYDAHLTRRMADPALVYPGLQPTVGGFLLHAPKALVVGLFRPFAWEADNVLQAWVGIENLLLLVVAGLTLWVSIRSKFPKGPHFILLLGALHYIVILAVLLSLAAPNFGEISRYKVSFLPFFIYILLLPLMQGNLKAIRKRPGIRV